MPARLKARSITKAAATAASHNIRPKVGISGCQKCRFRWIYGIILFQYRRPRIGTSPSNFRLRFSPEFAPIFHSSVIRTRTFSRDTVSMATITYQGLDVLYTRQQIADRVAEMGAQITRDLNDEKLVMVGVLKGAAIFLADLARSVQVDTTFDFVAVSSYGKGQRSSGAVKLIKDLDEPIEGKNVLIVEDILDTGLTLAYLRKIFLQHQPKTLRIAALLDKPSRRIEKIDADYVGFSIPNLIRHRIWNGLCRALSQSARHLPDGARSPRIVLFTTGNHMGMTEKRLISAPIAISTPVTLMR